MGFLLDKLGRCGVKEIVASSSSWTRFLFFRNWKSTQEKISRWPISWQLALLAPFIVIGVGLRMFAQTFPRNYDFKSYLVVSDMVLSGQNPYLSGRYNYGPIWFSVLAFLRLIARGPNEFRLAIAILLTACDVMIAMVLLRKRYALGAITVLLSPISVMISGQHQQFDNLAILIGLVACTLVPINPLLEKVSGRDWQAIILLSVSLMTKHVLILIPLWLAMQQKGWRRITAYLVIPPVIFSLSLLPFYLVDSATIFRTVLNHRSLKNSPLLRALLPGDIAEKLLRYGIAVPLCMVLSGIVGWYFRKVKGIELVLAYLVTFVLFSPAIVDQYLVIAMIGVAVFMNAGFLWWLILASIYLLGNANTILGSIARTLSLHIFHDPYQDLFLPLAIGWLLMLITLRRGVPLDERSEN